MEHTNFEQNIQIMKKLIILFSVIFLVSCQQKKLDRMQSVQDSLQHVEVSKDSAITDFIGTMNSIQANLDSIKQLEEIVNIRSKSNSEPKSSDRENILSDISVINKLLQQNRQMIADQKKKLGFSSYRVKEMQEMLNRMNDQLKIKDNEIAELRAQLENLHVNISGLNQNLLVAQERAQKQAQEITEKSGTIDQQTKKLNTAFYVFGTAKELVENGIVEKEGGFLGLGRTLKFRKDFNPDVFTEIDIRKVNEISLNAKKAKVITTHPAQSYELVGNDPVEKLVIQDPEKFWETNKYLVIVVN